MQNNMYSGIGRNPEEDAFQRRLAGILYPTEPVSSYQRDELGNYEWTTRVPDPYLGPNTRMLAYTYSTPRNTNIIDSRSTGWTVEGTYSPRSNRTMTGPQRAEYERIFPNFAPHAGALNASSNPAIVSHEMLHRLQDVRPAWILGEPLQRLDALFQSVGRNYNNRRLLNRSSLPREERLVVELLPYAIEDLNLAPNHILERMGVDRNLLNETVDGVRRSDLIARETRKIVEEAYTQSISSADYERASRRLEPPVVRGRGRPAYE